MENRGLDKNKEPAVSPNPLITLMTPGGNPASRDRAAMYSAVRGV